MRKTTFLQIFNIMERIIIWKKKNAILPDIIWKSVGNQYI
jgi:hypothetical protein